MLECESPANKPIPGAQVEMRKLSFTSSLQQNLDLRIAPSLNDLSFFSWDTKSLAQFTSATMELRPGVTKDGLRLVKDVKIPKTFNIGESVLVQLECTTQVQGKTTSPLSNKLIEVSVTSISGGGKGVVLVADTVLTDSQGIATFQVVLMQGLGRPYSTETAGIGDKLLGLAFSEWSRQRSGTTAVSITGPLLAGTCLYTCVYTSYTHAYTHAKCMCMCYSQSSPWSS